MHQTLKGSMTPKRLSTPALEVFFKNCELYLHSDKKQRLYYIRRLYAILDLCGSSAVIYEYHLYLTLSLAQALYGNV